jgi:hypothetical protein
MPLAHAAHGRPRTRREFIAQGFMTGAASVFGGSVFSLFANPQQAMAALSSDVATLRDSCGIAIQGAGKIPFIAFDLAGGANIAGSNVLVGGEGGQEDFLRTEGYNKLGLPNEMIPNAPAENGMQESFVNKDLGLAFHSDSAMLRGIQEKVSSLAFGSINGAVIPARSDNDTGNNPHNPMYGINAYGANGSLLSLIGSRSTDSGGNSMAPANMINPNVRPTKVDRPSDVTGLVDVGDLTSILSQDDAVAVMEAIQRISDDKLGKIDTKVSRNDVIKELIRCGYVKSADLADRFGDPDTLNPETDPDIVGPGGIFSSEEFNDREFQKTASVMKLTINGFAGAGTITMGGFDYHTGNRSTGESRDLRAGRCIGACLEYARRKGLPLMIYVFSDGSVASNGMVDDSEGGRGKGQWTGDNSSTAAAFFLVYDPKGGISLNPGAFAPQQLGYMRADASVETAATVAANNVNTLAETAILNYMALHGEQAQFSGLFSKSAIGDHNMDNMIAFEQIPSVSGGKITT